MARKASALVDLALAAALAGVGCPLTKPSGLWPMTVGAVPLAAVAWVATYLLTVRAVAAVREERRRRLERPAGLRPASRP